MAEAFIVRRGGVGSSGGTLVVTSSGAGTVTVSNSALGKSYSKSVTAGGSVTFKGLKTGEWTVTLSNGAQTTVRSVTINADYSVSIAYFSATISVTYPANSTCVVTNSSGQTVASDTNTGSSTKTWTATVGATGTYTVTATATDGSGESKSTTVSITAEGQSESLTLSYGFVLFDAGNQYTDITGGWSGTDYTVNTPYCGDNSAGAVSGTTLNCVAKSTSEVNGYSVIGTKNKVAEIANYNTLHVRVAAWANATSGDLETTPKTEFGVSTTKTNINTSRKAVKAVDGVGDDITLDISKVTVSGYLWIYAQAAGNAGNTTKIVVDKIWLEE